MSRLAEIRIKLRRPDRLGEQRAPCPWCDRGPRDDALAVKLEADGGATWFCHRCETTGGIGPDDRLATAPRRPKDARPEPERYDTLAPWAARIWASCRPIRSDTPAAAYLVARGCALPPWPEESDLRWRQDVHHPSGHVGPALVALVTDTLTCEPISLHRTWIKPDGSGKADLLKPRLLLKGHRSDGVVRLWPDAEVTTGLVLGEGIETCLAAAAAGHTPARACLSAGNLARFPVLPGLEGLTILVDHDRPDKSGRRPGIEAAHVLLDRYVAAGFDLERDLVMVLPPNEGEDAADLEKAS